MIKYLCDCCGEEIDTPNTENDLSMSLYIQATNRSKQISTMKCNIEICKKCFDQFVEEQKLLAKVFKEFKNSI